MVVVMVVIVIMVVIVVVVAAEIRLERSLDLRGFHAELGHPASSARRRRFTPSARRSSEAAKHQRTKPSPSGPNAAPGARPSPTSRTRRLQKARLSVTPSILKNAYIAPSGMATFTLGS